MDRLLSLSQAARLVGVPRRLLQQHIQEGRISAFEGYIRMSELRKAYPQADSDRSAMVEKVQRIRDAALFKSNPNIRADPERAATDLQRARIEMARLQEELESYRQLAAETEERLLDLQERCDARQAMMLGTLVGWYMNQLKLREDR